MDKSFTHLLYLLPVLTLASFFLVPFFEDEVHTEKEAVNTTAEYEAVFGPVPYPVVQEPEAAMPACNCTVTQGTFSAPLPFLSSNTSAVNFYNYGNPIASSANTGLEMPETMLIMLYEDLTSGATSLIIILDQANDGSGGEVNITFNCLPGSAFVEFSDDGGELSGSPPGIVGNFFWAPCCTDGGVIGGVGCGSTFTINPDILSGISAFSLVYGSPATPTYVSMPQLNCPITINCGGPACCVEAFEYMGFAINATCETSEDGSIDLTTDCATNPTFLWSNGEMTEDLFGLNPGTYTVTITDANGCTASETYTVEANNPSPQPNIIGPTEYCAGDIVDLSVDGAYISYQWSNGSTNPLIVVSTPGTYSVTVSNAFGCTGTASTVLIENPAPEPEIMGQTAICINDTTLLDAGGGFASYQWSTGETTQTIEASALGSYFVTVTNTFGCTGLDFVILEPLSTPFPMITGPNNICAGDPITLNAGNGYNTYQWSTGATSQTVTISTGGTYAVTVTNTEGCDGTDSYEVTAFPADTISMYQTSCNPGDTGVFVNQYTNQYGCDSVEILTVAFSDSDSIFLFDQSCNPADTGVFVSQYVNQYGCDSVETLTVTLLPGDNVFIAETSCSPQDTGTVIQTLTNQSGCDSIVTTTTTLLPSDTVELFDQSCDPANAGVTEELFTNQYGCDSLVITTTEFSLVDTTYLFDTSCDPQMTGVFEDEYTGSDGCDSLVITTVNLLLSDTTYLEANTCNSNQAGESEELLTNQDGCDSLVITNTTYIPPDTTLLFSESCDPAGAGIFEEVLANNFGCDSLVITTVSLLPTDTTALSQTSCDPNQAGTQEILLTNQFGCDSLVVITTTFSEADSTFLSGTTCNPSEAGVFFEVLVSTSDGCDSIVTTTITLLPSDTVSVTAQTCDPANAGITEELLTNQYGCDSLVITTTDLLPSDTTYLQDITCNIDQAGISEEILPNQYGCDSLIVTNTTYIPPDTTLLFSETCDPANAGIFEEVLVNQSGCDSLIITTVDLLPSDTTVLQEFTCDPGQVGTTQVLFTNVFGCDSLVVTNTAQLPIDTTLLFYETCLPSDTGLVVTVLSNQYGCDSLVYEQTSLSPPSECQLDAQIQGDTIGCAEASGGLILTFFNGMPPYAYTWTDQSGYTGSGTIDQIGVPQEVNGLPPGTYTFDILDPGGLMTTLTATVFQPDPLQIGLEISSDFNGYDVSCFGALDGSAAVTVLDGGLPGYSYNWSNGSQASQADGLGAGWTAVTVTGSVGCEAIDSVFLEQADALQFSLLVSNPDCFNDGMGAVFIDEVEGGTGPYTYSLNEGDAQTDPLFGDLSSGNYLVEVEDANGCTSFDYAFINSFIPPVVEIGQDTVMQWGDSLRIRPIINLPLSVLDSIYWNGVDCPDCPSVTVAPLVTSSYAVTIVDTLGCEASDGLNVFVRKDFQVYIPNAFSPDDNGINDFFTVFGGPNVVKILEFQIFSRWGEVVYTGFNLPPNDPSYGWDGTHRGEPVDSAVFVYFAVVEFADGSTRLFEGDVTLVR